MIELKQINTNETLEEAKVMANLLKVIANENRLYIICKLLEGDMTVGDIQIAVGQISQAAVSQHLSVLKAHQLVDSEKNGMHMRYFISDQRIKAVLAALKENYCHIK